MHIPALVLFLPLATLGAARLPHGWFLSDRGGSHTAHSMESCGQADGLGLESTAPSSSPATVMRLFEADAFRGQRVRLSARVAAHDVTGWAGLWMRVDGAEPHRALAFDNMQDRPLKGTRECADTTVVLEVPATAVTIAVGVVLEGEGHVELSGVKLEPVPTTVAATDLLGRGLTQGAMGQNPEELPNELSDSKGRIGKAWFNDFGVQTRGMAIHQRNPARWSDTTGDSLVTVSGDRLDVKLAGYSGDFIFRRDGEALVITGSWGKAIKYPVDIRLTRRQLDMSWGFYQRHLHKEDDAQAEPTCVRFVQYRGSLLTRSDLVFVCGEALEANAPAVQTTVAFLLTGFRWSPAAPGADVGW